MSQNQSGKGFSRFATSQKYNREEEVEQALLGYELKNIEFLIRVIHRS